MPVWTASSCALLAHLRTDALRADVGDQGAFAESSLPFSCLHLVGSTRPHLEQRLCVCICAVAAGSRADELLVSYPGLGSYRVSDLPAGVVTGDFNYVVSRLVHRIGQLLLRAAPAAVALNTFPGLDSPDVTEVLAETLPNCLPLGPYHLLLPKDITDAAAPVASDPHGCLAWLDAHPARSVVYVAFGTVASPRPDELRELAAGLESSGAPFLWSLREDSWPLLPAGFLARAAAAGAGLVVPWAPQVAVLRHASVGAFVTHAGWASVLEGVASGELQGGGALTEEAGEAWGERKR